MPNYIPTSDAALDAWSANFASLITATPGLYGLFAADALTIQNSVDAYHDAYQIAGLSGTPPKTPLSPSTRTPVTIATKDATRNAMLAIVRVYALQIRNNVGVSNSDKTDLGLTIVKTIPTPIPEPVTTPLVTMVATDNAGVTFNMRDSGTPSVKRKPFGAIGAQAWISYGNTPPVSPLLGTFVGNVTKSPSVILTDNAHAGDTAYLYLRWVTRTGLVGPWSSVLTFIAPNTAS